MKTKKLNLNELKVESFVTSLEGKDAQTVKGGTGVTVSETFRMAAVVSAVIVISVAVTAVVKAVDGATESGNTESGSKSDKK